MFGVGSELDGAIAERLTAESPVKMLSSWYSSPSDLGFMNGWQGALIPQAYARGYALHLIVWTNDSEQQLSTPYGPACGRAYPLSASFLNDMRQLARVYNGTGPLYVSMFTEFQTYPCQDNNWAGSENYYRALQDQYRAAVNIFHGEAPRSKVSLTWGGWAATYDDPAKGGGRSLLPPFAGVMRASDYQSFQAMDTSANTAQIMAMTKLLHPYGPVMVSHYKPDNGSQATFNADMGNVFTPTNVAALRANGLFAFNFMDSVNINASEEAYQKVKAVVQTYGE
jgi:hypothetical protein